MYSTSKLTATPTDNLNLHRHEEFISYHVKQFYERVHSIPCSARWFTIFKEILPLNGNGLSLPYQAKMSTMERPFKVFVLTHCIHQNIDKNILGVYSGKSIKGFYYRVGSYKCNHSQLKNIKSRKIKWKLLNIFLLCAITKIIWAGFIM
jgi:hypothetical protein